MFWYKKKSPKCLPEKQEQHNLPLVICKFHKELIKMKGYPGDKVKYGLFQHSRADNSTVITHVVWPDFKLIWDFMSVLVKKMKVLVWRQGQMWAFLAFNGR